MPQVECHIVNAFVDKGQGGNPAGVVLDADQLSDEEKQDIAAIVGKPETAFVSASSKADFKVEFFSPSRQIPHCGHATVAAFSLLKSKGRIGSDRSSKEAADGDVRSIRFSGERVFLQQAAPQGEELTSTDVALLIAPLGLESNDLLYKPAPMIVSTSNRFLILGVKSRKILKSISSPKDNPVVAESITEMSGEFNLIGYYLYALDTIVPGRHATTRMFAPACEIPEEAATGTGAAPLACVLYLSGMVNATKLVIEQGHLMPIPSPSVLDNLLGIDRQGRIKGIHVGGKAKYEETISIDY
jgi:PhzF family phenazine biosynthesis protein